MTRIRFDHIAIGMSRMVDATEMLVGTLGGVPAYGKPSGDFRWVVDVRGRRRLEMLEPMGTRLPPPLPRGARARASTTSPSRCRASTRSAPRRARGLRRRGPRRLRPGMEGSLPPSRSRRSASSCSSPSPAGGDAAQSALAAAPGRPMPPAPVTIVGLRLRAHSRERARRQWETVLEGQSSEGPARRADLPLARLPDAPRRRDRSRTRRGPRRHRGRERPRDRAAGWPAPDAGHRLQAGQDFSRAKTMKMWPESAGATNAVGAPSPCRGYCRRS